MGIYQFNITSIKASTVQQIKQKKQTVIKFLTLQVLNTKLSQKKKKELGYKKLPFEIWVRIVEANNCCERVEERQKGVEIQREREIKDRKEMKKR